MSDARFPRSMRLLRREDFLRVQRGGRRIRTRHLLACWASGPHPGFERFGLTVSRKVGNAVTRNRVKRWLREAIRRRAVQVEGVDVVFIARRRAADAGARALAHDVAQALDAIRDRKSS